MKTSSKLVALGLLLVGFVLVNVIAKFLPWQMDFTAENLFTLSSGSKTMLKKIEDPVTLNFYFTQSAEDIPIMIKNFASRVEGLLHQYERAAGGKIILNVIDPRPDTKEEEEAVRAGVHSERMPNGENFILGLAISQADQEEVIPFFSNDRESFLEYDISRAIHKVQQAKLPRMGVISSLNVVGQEASPLAFRMNPNLVKDWAFVRELKNSFEVQKIDSVGDGGLPKDLDLLVVIHPQNLPDATLYAIDQFLLSGKPVFVAVDPYSRIGRQQGGQPQMMQFTPPSSSDMPKLFSKWGIKYDAGKVVGDNLLATSVNQGNGNIAAAPTWLTIQQELASDAPPTAQLKEILFVEPGAFSVDEKSGLEVTPLITTSNQSDTIEKAKIGYSTPGSLTRQMSPDGKTRILAAIIRGSFQSAFPEGKPSGDQGGQEKGGDQKPAKKEETESNHLKASAKPGTLILVADTDFMADSFSVRELNFFGMKALSPLNDNLAFVSNSMEYLSGSEDLISIRGKGTTSRSFDVVRDLRIKAQARFEQEEEKINNKLSEIRNQLQEQENRGKKTGELVLDASAQEAIREMKNQEADFLKQRREIRKKLREDIERLKFRLCLLNLLLVPLAIGAGALYFFIRRRSLQNQI